MLLSIEPYQNVLKNSLLGYLQNDSFEKVLNSGDLFHVDVGTPVPRGQTPQDLFVLLEGEFSFFSPQGFELGQSKVGRSFELSTLMTAGKEWKERWRCDKRSVLFRIKWELFMTELKKDALSYEYLVRVTSSVQLQKLKRDMIALNVNKTTMIEIIASMNPERFDLIFSDWKRKAFLTVLTGEIGVSVLVGNQKNAVGTFQIGDSCFLDLENSDYVYTATPGGMAYVIYESKWSGLASKETFNEFLRVYRPQRDNRSEKTMMFSTRVFSSSAIASSLDENSSKESSATLTSKIENDHLNMDQDSHGFRQRWKMFRYSRHITVQEDELRSGAAALSTLAKISGWDADIESFSQNFPIHTGAKSILALKSVAEAWGFESDLLALFSANSGETFRSAVVVTQEGFRVLFEKDGQFAIVGELDSGATRIVPWARFLNELADPRALILKAPAGMAELKANHISVFRYLELFKGSGLALVLFFCAGVLSYLMNLIPPFMSQFIFDEVLVSGRRDLLTMVIGSMFFALLLGALFDHFNQIMISKIQVSVGAKLTSVIHSLIFKLPSSYFKNGGFSAVISRVQSIERVSGFLAGGLMPVALALVLSGFSFGIMWIYHLNFLYIILGTLPVQVVILVLIQPQLMNRGRREAAIKARENGLIYQHFRSPDNTKVVQGELTQRWQFEKNTLSYLEVAFMQTRFDSFVGALGFLSSELGRIGVLVYAANLYTNGQMSLGKVLAVTTLVPRLTGPLQQLVSTYFAYLNTKPSMDRLTHFFNMPKEHETLDAQAMDLNEIRGEIHFKNVHYKYEDGEHDAVLRNVSFEIKKGEFVVVVGPTGSGKTTLAALMGNLVRPTSGEIRIDSRGIDHWSSMALRRRIGFVEQEGAVFAGNFQQNISMWQESPDHQRVAEAAKIADLDEYILSTPEGYATEVGSLGAGVSEGQKQRLLIARTVYANPNLLILDESTSHLDPISEERVMSRVLKKFTGKTIVFFTQRIHLATRADRIFYMEAGELVESGPHSELIKKNGKYYEFFCNHLSLG